MMRNKRGRKSIDMIPMIDVVFQLILFFLVSTTFAMLPGINLQLPESSTAKASAISDLFVIVINRNEVYLNNDKIPLDNLESALSVFSQSEMSNITLEADESVSYGLIIETLDILRKSGYQNINLHTIER